MRFIESLCPPALLYLLYIIVHVGLDLSLGLFLTAAVKIVMGIAGTIILDALCGVELGIVSWAIVATPFIMVALATTISMGLGLDRLMSKYVTENFSPMVAPTDAPGKDRKYDFRSESFVGVLTGDNKKNRDKYVTQLKQADALPLSSNSMY